MKTVSYCLFLLVLLCVLHEAVLIDLGPTNSVVTGTFTGADQKTPCKYCQINCYDVPVFKQGSCESKYFTYGCDIQHVCFSITSVSKFQFYTAVAMCAKYNKCQFLDVLNDVKLNDGSLSQFEAKRSRNLMDMLIYQGTKLNWRETVDQMTRGILETDDSKEVKAKEMQEALDDYIEEVSAVAADQGYKRNLSPEDADRLNTYLASNAKRFGSKSKMRQNMKWDDSFLATLAQWEIGEIQKLDDETKRRKFREYVLQKVTPSLPPSVYLYFKIAQDAKVDIIAAKEAQIPPTIFTEWMNQDIQLSTLSDEELAGLKQQIARKRVRLDRLMDWVNTFSTTYYTQFFKAYEAMLTAGTKIRDYNVGIKSYQNCNGRTPPIGKSKSPLTADECSAVNDKVKQEDVLNGIDKTMRSTYQALLQEFAREAGVRITTQTLGPIATSLFFKVAN